MHGVFAMHMNTITATITTDAMHRVSTESLLNLASLGNMLFKAHVVDLVHVNH